MRVASLLVGYKHNDILKEAYRQVEREREVTNDDLIHFSIRARALIKGLDDQLVMQEIEEHSKIPSERRTSCLVTDEERADEQDRGGSSEASTQKKPARKGFSIEEKNNIKRASLNALKDSGASPSLCHSNLVRELGLTKITKGDALKMQGAFD